jgi:hypothetical protein
VLSAQFTAIALAAAFAAGGCGGASKEVSSATTASTEKATSTPSTASGPATTSSPSPTPPPAVAVPIATGKPLSRSQWIARGDAICAKLNGELSKLPTSKISELPRVLPHAAALERVEVGQLAKLVPPASRTHDWERFLTDTLQWAEGSAKLAGYAKLGEAITASPVATATLAIHNQLTKLAKRDGFKDCSK